MELFYQLQLYRTASITLTLYCEYINRKYPNSIYLRYT